MQNPDERRAYDAALASRRLDVVISDELELEEMDEESAHGREEGESGSGDGATEDVVRFRHKCRCGDFYEVLSSDLHPDFDHVDVPCVSCSLYVRVTYGDARRDT